MKTILEAIQSRGIDPQTVVLNATVRRIPAGESRGWDGAELKSFDPSVTSLGFCVKGSSETFMEFTNAVAVKVSDELYWAGQEVPNGVDVNEAKSLTESFLQNWRTLSGQVSTIDYGTRSRDAEEIKGLLSECAVLSLDLMHLVDYLRVDDEMFDALFKDDRVLMDELTYKRACLLSQFREAPCSREEFNALYKEYTEGNYMAVGLGNFYGWSQRFKENLDTNGNLTQELKDRVTEVIKAWSIPGSSAKFITARIDSLCRNFNVPPKYRPIFEKFAEEAFAEARAYLEEEVTETPRG